MKTTNKFVIGILLLVTAFSYVDASSSNITRADTAKIGAGKTLLIEPGGILSGTVTPDSLTLIPEKTFVSGKDTTITGFSADIVKRYSLNDPAVMWDRDAFQGYVAASSIGSRGDTTSAFPTNFAVVIDSNSDSLGIVNTDTGEQWIWFVTSGASGTSHFMAGGAAISLNDVHFKDGYLRVASSGFIASVFIDFVKDERITYATSGIVRWGGNIGARNTLLANTTMNASPAIADNTVNVVSAIRDPEGGVDEFGRPLHYWAAGTDTEVSIYNPINNAIYDMSSSGGSDVDALAMASDGALYMYHDHASADRFLSIRHIQSQTADAFGEDFGWIPGGTGGRDLPWGAAFTNPSIAIIEGSSIAQVGSHIALFGSAEGFAVKHHFPFNPGSGEGQNDLSYAIDADRIAGPWSGTVGMHVSLDDATEAFGNDLTNNNTVTFATQDGWVAANFVAASSQSLTDADVAAHTPSTSAFSGEFWVRREIDSGANEGLVNKYDDATAADQSWRFVISSDAVTFSVAVTGPSLVNVATPAISLNTWYHVAGTWDGATMRIYLDGVETQNDSQSGTMIDATEPFTVGAASSGGSPTLFFDGQIKGVNIYGRALSAKEVAHRHKQGRDAMQMNVTADDALVGASVQDVEAADDGSIWVLAGASTSADSTLHRLTSTGVVSDTLTQSGIVDFDVWNVRGAKPDSTVESYGLAIALGTGGLRLIQPDPVVRDAQYYVNHVYQGPRVYDAIVDSSGACQQYWVRGMTPCYYNVQDAVDAHPGPSSFVWTSQNNTASIFVKSGTYPPFTVANYHVKIKGENRNSVLIDGGTTGHAITITGGNVTIESLAVSTTGGGGNSYDCINIDGGNGDNYIRDVYVRDSDRYGMIVQDPGTVIDECFFLAGDAENVYITVASCVVRATVFNGTSGSYNIENAGDNNQFTGNYSYDTGTFLQLQSGGDNCVAVGNISNGAITDASTGSTVTGNEQY